MGQLEGFIAPRFVLTDYISAALAEAIYDKLDDGTFAAGIPACPGVIAYGKTQNKCEIELQATLEDWILAGIKLGQMLPVIGGIDLNKEPHIDTVESV